jgi:hypothetical protein
MTTKQLCAKLNDRMESVPAEVWGAILAAVMKLIQGCKDTPQEALDYVREARGNLRHRVVVAAMFRRAWVNQGLPRRKMDDGLEALLEEADFVDVKDVKRMFKEAAYES